MSTINYDLTRIKALAFDVDGVLSADVIPLHPSGEPMRTVNIKDGYAIQLAVKKGLHIAIITGGRTDAVQKRFAGLGVSDLYLGSAIKGGYGCGRDVVEQVLKAQGKWLSDDAFGW